MPSKSPKFPGPLTSTGAVLAVLAVLLSSGDQTGAEPLAGRVTLAAIVKILTAFSFILGRAPVLG